MFKRGDDFNFAQKAFDQIGAPLHIGQQDFHRLDSFGENVTNLENLPHSSPADHRDDLVIPDSRSGFENRRPRGHKSISIGE